jgi:hypothetical protein
MPTLDDLRATYAALAQDAHTELVGVLSIDSTPRSRHRVGVPALLSAAVVAAATVGITVAGVASSDHHVAAGSTPSSPVSAVNAATSTPTAATARIAASVLPATSYVFKVGALPSGIHATQYSTSTAEDQTTLVSSDGSLVGIVTVAATKAWRPAIPANPTPVKIGSLTGYYGILDFTDANSPEADLVALGATRQGVVWRDQSGLWAYVAGNGYDDTAVSQAQLVAIANAVQIGVPTSLKVPFTVGYQPAGFKTDITTIDSNPAITKPDPSFDDVIASTDLLNPTSSASTPGSLWIALMTGSAQQATHNGYPPSATGTTISVAGFSGRYNPGNKNLVLTNGKLTLVVHGGVFSGSYHGPSVAEITKLVKSITLASDPTNQSTWIDAE